MATTTKSTDLDFDNIKARLKDYLKKQPQFNAYDFEAAGLSNILDVLAYNSHINALNANFALNESFLSTAQLRSSVVSHAQTLGYEIRSTTSSRAIVNLSLNLTGVPGRPITITLPKGTVFTSSVDGVTYTFRTLEEYSARDNGSGSYVFLTNAASNGIPIFEGVEKTKTFIVGQKDERQIYVIPDDTIDKSTAIVRVYSSVTSSNYTTYFPLSQAVIIDENAKFFSINEVPNGYYELNFGDGTSFGKSPEPGEKIVITYLSSKGAAANNATVFNPNNQIRINGIDYVLTTVTAGESTGGASRQSIESIRQLAPIAYASQKRLVTSLDYKAMIETNFSQVREAAIWSGDQNIPIDYGAVYISLNYAANTAAATKQAIKDAIVNNFTNNLSVMSMTPKFVEPIDVWLSLNVQFNFDPALTGNTAATTEVNVFKFIQNYFNTNLSTFNAVFRKSNLATEIDAFDPSILSTRMDIKVQMRQVIDTSIVNTFDLEYPCKIADPDDVFWRIQSTTFEYKAKVARIQNRLNSNSLSIIDLAGNILLDNVGSYNKATGKVSIVGFKPTRMTNGGNTIRIDVIPAVEGTIKPLRNYILKFEADKSSTSAVVDRQTPSLEITI
jgi:hypothetical protein